MKNVSQQETLILIFIVYSSINSLVFGSMKCQEIVKMYVLVLYLDYNLIDNIVSLVLPLTCFYAHCTGFRYFLSQ